MYLEFEKNKVQTLIPLSHSVAKPHIFSKSFKQEGIYYMVLSGLQDHLKECKGKQNQTIGYTSRNDSQSHIANLGSESWCQIAKLLLQLWDLKPCCLC